MADLATAMFLVILDAAMVNLAGPAIREGLTLTAAELTIVVDGYLVAFAGLLLLGGRLADVLGGRNVFLAGMGVYLAASAWCALATSGAAGAGEDIAFTTAFLGQAALILIALALSLVPAAKARPAPPPQGRADPGPAPSVRGRAGPRPPSPPRTR